MKTRKCTKENRLKIVSITVAAFMIIYLCADYFNVASRVGLKLYKINSGFLGIVVAAITAFLVFFYTYYFVEQWNIKKNENLRKMGHNMIVESLKGTKIIYKKFDSEQIRIVKYVTENCSVSTVINSLEYMASVPFSNEKIVFQCAAQGILSSELVMKYYQLKTAISTYCTMAVLFTESTESVAFAEADLKKTINDSGVKSHFRKIEVLKNRRTTPKNRV